MCYFIVMKRILAIFRAACIFWIAAAYSYQPKIVHLLPMESYPARVTVGDVTIAADPYASNDKSYTAFDIKDLNSRGYFPVHVIIQNATKDYMSIRTRNIVLINKKGQQFYTTPAAILVDDIFKGGLTGKVPKSSGEQLSYKTGSPLYDFSEKELTNRLIDPGTISSGFLFFYSSDSKQNLFEGSTLFIPKLEEEGTHRVVGPFSIHLNPAEGQETAPNKNSETRSKKPE
jgi:hypothetical protein